MQTGNKKDGTPAYRKSKVNVVNETGLYVCIMRSRKKEAEDFLYYVAETVLPELRRTGGYFVGEETLDDAEKEDARRSLKELQSKYTTLQEEHQALAADYDSLFMRTKDALGVGFAMGTGDAARNDGDYVVTKEGWIVRKDMLD